MRIAINKKNKERIASALKNVNGRAQAHTYECMREILYDIEYFCMSRAARGKKYLLVSGVATSSSYNYPRVATALTITRTSRGWSILLIEQTKVWPRGGYYQEQDQRDNCHRVPLKTA